MQTLICCTSIALAATDYGCVLGLGHGRIDCRGMVTPASRLLLLIRRWQILYCFSKISPHLPECPLILPRVVPFETCYPSSSWIVHPFGTREPLILMTFGCILVGLGPWKLWPAGYMNSMAGPDMLSPASPERRIKVISIGSCAGTLAIPKVMLYLLTAAHILNLASGAMFTTTITTLILTIEMGRQFSFWGMLFWVK